MRRYEYIDALRGVAALAVVGYHVFRDMGRYLDPRLMEITAQGARGVQLFYVLSAFTLFMSLHEREKLGEVSTGSFFLRRFFRIAPMFYVSLAFYLWLYGRGPRFALGNQPYLTGVNILANILFVNGFGPYWINSIIPVGWSVAVEMSFYALIPFLHRRIHSLSRAVWLTLGSLAASLLAGRYLAAHPLISSPKVWEMYLSWWFPNQFPVFALGMVLFFLVTGDWAAGMELEHPRRRRMGRAMLFVSLLLLIVFARWPYRILPDQVTPSPVLYLYAGAFVLLCLALAIHPSRLVVNRFFRYAGKVSYSIYLTHWACVLYVRRFMSWLQPPFGPAGKLMLLGCLALASTLLVSTVAYHLIELPFQRLGGRLIRRLRERRHLTAPAA